MRLMRPTTRKKRERMIQMAMQMFVERGYDAVSVDDIIQATGTSKGTFYHYFKGKDEIIAELIHQQTQIVEHWSSHTPAKVESLEGHINRLFLDLSSIIAESRRVMRSLLALQCLNETVAEAHRSFSGKLLAGIGRWLPEHGKAQALVTMYHGCVVSWCLSEDEHLPDIVRRRFAYLWSGLRSSSEAEELQLAPSSKEGKTMKIAIIGGGLAGLTAAAYLSESAAVEGVLFERSPQLGGRAFTYERSGFTLNYGAHAIYGIDRHELSTMEKELGLSFSSRQVDKRKVMYAKDNKLTPAPLDFVGLLNTEVLTATQKVRFVAEIAAVMANIHLLRNYRTLGDYLAESGAADDVKELWEHLVCSNFFITPEDARKVPGPAIADYYHNLFLSQRPVNYVLGSWAVITNQLQSKIEGSGRWSIALREGVESIRYEKGRYMLRTKEQEHAFDRIVFAMPVQQAAKLLRGSPWEPFLAPYEDNIPTEVLVYDVGLSRVVARPFSYISDMEHKLFISDVSATDTTLVPQEGQLLQGIAYLNDSAFEDEESRKAYLDERLALMERLFDAHYPGWREASAVKRVSKKAMVQSVKNIEGNKLLPNRLESVPFYFCGDGTEGKGELAERAFSSARRVASLLLREVSDPVMA